MPTTVTLPDGRTLEYADLGDPAGRPVLFFHGTPGTAGSGAAVGAGAGCRRISGAWPERPGPQGEERDR